MSQIQEILRAAIKKGATPEAATATALARASRGDLISFVRPVVESEAQRIARCMTSVREAAFEPVAIATPEALQALKEDSFWVDGEMVPWAKATAAQHLARAAAQRRMAGGLIRDAERHEAAAQAIHEAGVSCLAELPGAILASKPEVPAPRAKVPSRHRPPATHPKVAAGREAA